jgi:MYXO-CTERM domain-containing protein
MLARRLAVLLLPLPVLALTLVPSSAAAEEPLAQRYTFTGNADFFATGAAMAADGMDVDATNVDHLVHPAITTITDDDIPQDAILRKAYLYWGGSIENDDCVGGTIDETVTFTPPGGMVSAVVAETCYCSDAAASSYDIQLCRADVTQLVDTPIGDYAVDDFSALIENGTTNNASFSIVLVYSANSLPVRSIALYDGLLTMWDQSNPEEVVILDQIVVDDPPAGDLTWYALEGDVGGVGNEGVSVVGTPGNGSSNLFDLINPVQNPMNHTINTTWPQQGDALGVDIDQFDIAAALTAGDTAVETTYRGGGDKYWIAYNVVGVNIFAPEFGSGSSKTWVLQQDADQSGDPSPGDTIRYTIHLANNGDVAGVVGIDDTMPSQVESWMLIDDGGGTDASTAQSLIIDAIALAAGESTDVVFDVVIAPGTEGTDMINVAGYDAPPDGGSGAFEALPVPIVGGAPGDGDGDGDGDPGDGDGDPGDGDGDPGDGDPGDGDGSGGSGEDGSTTGEPGDGTGSTGIWPGGLNPETGCSCASEPASPTPTALGLLALAWLGMGGSRRRRHSAEP